MERARRVRLTRRARRAKCVRAIWVPVFLAAVMVMTAMTAAQAAPVAVTLAPPLEPIEKVEVGQNAELLVNGKPFLPIMLWLQNETHIKDGLAIGVNTFAGNGSHLSNRIYLDRLADAGLYGVLHFDTGIINHPYLLGWIHNDEPDYPGKRASDGSRWPRMSVEEVAEVYQRIKEADTASPRPVFLTFTAYFMKELTTYYTQEQKAAIYPPMAANADIVGFDVYPIAGWNRPDWLYRVADGISDLREVAGAGKPLYAWIETNKGGQWISPEMQLPVTPADTRAEVWMALIRGATGIGYFTHSWVPSYTQFAPDSEMVAALRQLNERLARLAPALLAPPAPEAEGTEMVMPSNIACHFKMTKLNNDLWIFAQNIDMRRLAGRATFRLPGLEAGTIIEVIDEDRLLVAGDGQFSDDYAPLAEHVYRIRREPYVIINSPQDRAGLTSPQPVDFQVVWEKAPYYVQVELDGSIFYSGESLPSPGLLTIDPSRLEQGHHVLTVRVGDGEKSAVESVGFSVPRSIQINGLDGYRYVYISGLLPISVTTTNIAVAEAVIVIDGKTEEPLYQGAALPEMTIDTLQLSEGEHTIEIRIRDIYGREFSHQTEFIVKNYQIMDDDILPPTNFFSFWGTGPVDLSMTHTTSAGWDYADQSVKLFGDGGRRVRRADTAEFLIWDTPQFHNATLTIYARSAEPDLDLVLDHVTGAVRLYLSQDLQADSWTPLAYSAKVLETASDGWYLIELDTETVIDADSVDGASGDAGWRWFKLVFQDYAPADELQLGKVVVRMRRY